MDRVASLFMNGGSQAVRLPKVFRFEGPAVRIFRDGTRVVLEPIEKAVWPPSFFDELARAPLSADFKMSEPLLMSEYREAVIRELADE